MDILKIYDEQSSKWQELPALKGSNGLYVGNTEPTDPDIHVWIDTTSSGIRLVDYIYPVGSIYISVNNTSPSTLFGGTWEQIQDDMLHVEKEPLWVNEDPSANFPAQTITIDLSSYKKVLIKVRYGAASGIRENNFMQFVCDVGEGTILWVMNYSNDFTAEFTPGVNYRLATVTTSGVTFTTCAIKALNVNGVPTTGDAGCIPWAIYGIGSENSKYVWKRVS